MHPCPRQVKTALHRLLIDWATGDQGWDGGGETPLFASDLAHRLVFCHTFDGSLPKAESMVMKAFGVVKACAGLQVLPTYPPQRSCHQAFPGARSREARPLILPLWLRPFPLGASRLFASAGRPCGGGAAQAVQIFHGGSAWPAWAFGVSLAPSRGCLMRREKPIGFCHLK